MFNSFVLFAMSMQFYHFPPDPVLVSTALCHTPWPVPRGTSQALLKRQIMRVLCKFWCQSAFVTIKQRLKLWEACVSYRDVKNSCHMAAGSSCPMPHATVHGLGHDDVDVDMTRLGPHGWWHLSWTLLSIPIKRRAQRYAVVFVCIFYYLKELEPSKLLDSRVLSCTYI